MKQKQLDEEKVFKYLFSFVSNDAIYTRENKTRFVMAKAAFKKDNLSLQILEEQTVMCYI